MNGGFNNKVAMCVGRLNPPTRGHDVMVKELKKVAKMLGARPVLFIVDGAITGKDKSKNPLNASQRLAIATKLFPGVDIDVVSSAYEALEVLEVQGLLPKAWIAGSDRVSNYRKLVSSEKLECEVVEVSREAGEADGVSATSARKAALEGDMTEFTHHMPSNLTVEELADIMKMIREVNNVGAIQV